MKKELNFNFKTFGSIVLLSFAFIGLMDVIEWLSFLIRHGY